LPFGFSQRKDLQVPAPINLSTNQPNPTQPKAYHLSAIYFYSISLTFAQKLKYKKII
jgi:hypothetical protein